MDGGLGQVTKHPDYYLTDGSVSFLTGNTLFRVHRSFFERESEVFRDFFASAAEEDVQSGTDARPFTLDVKPHEFEQLLWIWYDREYSYLQQTKPNWITILKLANRWQFHKIRELAIRELDALGLPPAERIAIYNQHGIDDERLLDSYVELCKSPTVPTEEEARLLQMERLINVLQAREDAQRKAYKLRHESPTSAGLEDETLREIVLEFFKAGLDPRSNGTSMGTGVQTPDLTFNGHTQGTGASETIKLGHPQPPDRGGQPSGPSSHANSSFQNDGKENHEQDRAKSDDTRGKAEKSQDKKLPKATQEEEKQEKAKLAKENEEKKKAEKAKQEREREEREKQKVKQAKEKEEKEKLEKHRKAGV